MSDETIRDNLRHAGWREDQVRQAFVEVSALAARNNPATGSNIYFGGVSGSELEEKSSKKNYKKVIIFASSIFVILLLAFGGLVGYFYLSPLFVKAQIFQKLTDIQSGKLDGRIIYKNRTPKTKSPDLEFWVTGFFALAGEKEDFDVKTGMNGYMDYTVDSQMMSVNGKNYMRYNSFPVDTAKTNKVKGIWFYQNGGQMAANQGSSAMGLKDLVKDPKIFKTFKQMDDTNVDGVDCYEFSFDLDTVKASDALIKIFESQGEVMTESEKADFEKSFRKLSKIDGNAYIGKKDSSLHKVDITIESPDLSLDTSFNISEINGSHNFVEPKDAKPYEELPAPTTSPKQKATPQAI